MRPMHNIAINVKLNMAIVYENRIICPLILTIRDGNHVQTGFISAIFNLTNWRALAIFFQAIKDE